jgi:PelA/Pel-15E family pectate lyase
LSNFHRFADLRGACGELSGNGEFLRGLRLDWVQRRKVRQPRGFEGRWLVSALRFGGIVIFVGSGAWPAVAAELTVERAEAALSKAVRFFDSEVSAEGGYLWRYSADLARREGEGKADARTAWVQPPGTPSVGMALLDVYKLTRDRQYLDAARHTAHALVAGQLHSGGWDYRIHFDPRARRRYAYRVEGESSQSGRNVTTLDDNTTQSALTFLMRIDKTLDFKDERIHDAAQFALSSLLKAQDPNGAWPQRYSEFPDPATHPVKKASYPKSWSRTYVKKDYRDYYTFNDNTIADTIEMMFLAERIYGDAQYGQAARRGGDFILLAQMPEPQPAWAQQYDLDMHPAWARKFEPPAVTGGESQGVMRTLLSVYSHTGDKKYLEPIPRAMAYLKKSRRPDGRLARFYELKTNKPLYFTKDYKLTYSDDDMPTHYGFVVGSKLDSIERAYEKIKNTPVEELQRERTRSGPRLSNSLARRVQEIVDALDERGAWVEDGRLKYHGGDDPARRVISSDTFSRNIRTLAQFIAAAKGRGSNR